MFEGSSTSPAVQQSAIEQQKKILEAVVTGKGWENFNPDMRKRVDTPLYRSFLMFEPAQVIVKVRQPMLVMQPMLDREVPGVSRRTACAARPLAPARAGRPSSCSWPASIICSRGRPPARSPSTERSRNAASARPRRSS